TTKTRGVFVDNVPDGNQTDTNAPTVIITSPTSNPNYDTNFATINLSGTAIDNVGIISMAWGVSTDGNGIVSYNSSTNTWSASNIPLIIGQNLIIITARDAAGNIGNDSINVRRDANQTDFTPPVLVITYPSPGQTVSGTVNITADSNDSGTGVNNLKFYIDNVLKFTDYAPPYSYAWDSNSVPDGNHTIKIISTDNANNSTTKTQGVFVDNNAVPQSGPEITITNPQANSTVSGTIDITTIITDPDGIDSVVFFIDNIQKLIDLTAPYTYTWNTTQYADGNHSISVQAFDALGYDSTETINVYVNN
ncbi:MAG: Ig-like domain-containing protein, partial [archaeon]|nr:Ig-like domain-containing protein [archaeon]